MSGHDRAHLSRQRPGDLWEQPMNLEPSAVLTEARKVLDDSYRLPEPTTRDELEADRGVRRRPGEGHRRSRRAVMTDAVHTGKPTTWGPYETDRQAAEDCREVYALAYTRAGAMTERNRERLTEACAAAGVELGAFDAYIVNWLAGWEPETVQVLIGIISRAGARS